MADPVKLALKPLAPWSPRGWTLVQIGAALGVLLRFVNDVVTATGGTQLRLSSSVERRAARLAVIAARGVLSGPCRHLDDSFSSDRTTEEERMMMAVQFGVARGDSPPPMRCRPEEGQGRLPDVEETLTLLYTIADNLLMRVTRRDGRLVSDRPHVLGALAVARSVRSALDEALADPPKPAPLACPRGHNLDADGTCGTCRAGFANVVDERWLAFRRQILDLWDEREREMQKQLREERLKTEAMGTQ